VTVGVTSLINVLGNHLASGKEPGRHGNAHPNIAPYESFRAADGYLVVAVGNDAQFSRLLGVLGIFDAEGRFASNADRVGTRRVLADWLGAAIAGWRRDELVAALVAADVPAGPVSSVPEAVASMGHGWTTTLDGVSLAPSPLLIDDATAPTRLPPPRLGEHTDEVLSALGSP
jgi:crotonobetainyl-CoA:carnitine CoA-transferase CaiB-like acyl-CoA transferase